MISDHHEKTSADTSKTFVPIRSLSENPEFFPIVLEYLYLNEKECMFLIGNLESYGATKGDHLNSGDFFFTCSKDSNLVSCVYSLCNSGVLLIYADPQNTSDSELIEIVQKLVDENSKVSGLIGEEVICSRFFRCFKNFLSSISAEILVKSNLKNVLLELNDLDSRIRPELGFEHQIRLLKLDDFDCWNDLIIQFSLEIKIQINPREAQLQLFEELTEKRHVWGCFKGEELASIVRLNSVTRLGGSIGGVFTSPRYRKQGLARALIIQLITDSSTLLNLQHLTLFTEETNNAALNLYKSLGFQQRGFYKMCFFNIVR